MKRYGMKDLVCGTVIEFSRHRMYEKAPRVVDYVFGDVLGYITFATLQKLSDESRLVKISGDYWLAYYKVI